MADGPIYTGGGVPIQIEFWLDNKAASSTQDMNRWHHGTLLAHTTWRAPRGGWYCGISLVTSEARTGGSISSARFTISNTASGADSGAMLNATFTRENTFWQGPGVDRFASGDLLGVEIVSASWAPTTAEMYAILYIILD